MNIYLHTIKVLDSRNWTAEQPKHMFVQNTLRDGGLDALNKWASEIMYTVTYDRERRTLEVDHAGHTNTFYVKLQVEEFVPADKVQEQWDQLIVGLHKPDIKWNGLLKIDSNGMGDRIIGTSESGSVFVISEDANVEFIEEPSFTNRLTSLRYKALSVIEAFMEHINELYCADIVVNEVIIFRQTNNLSLYKISKLDDDSIIVEFSGSNALALSSLTTENVCQIADYLQTVKQKKSWCGELTNELFILDDG